MKSNFKIKIGLIMLIVLTNSCSLNVPSLLSSVVKAVSTPTPEPINSNKNDIKNEVKNVDPPKVEDNEKTQLQELHINIKSFKDILDIYANKKNGYYPESFDDLYYNALENSYWKKIKNPYTSKLGTGISGSLINIKEYRNYTTQSALKGLIVYEPLKCTDTKDNCNYKIYGTDRNGALLE